MTFTAMEGRSDPRPLARYSYLSVVRAGLAAHKYAYARETVLTWLAHYPGDLYAGLCYAEALVGEGRLAQALQVLQGLCMADPEFSEAADLLFKIQIEAAAQARAGERPNERRKVFAPGLALANYQAALTGEAPAGSEPAPWPLKLYQARQALEAGRLEQAQGFIREALSLQAAHPLAAVTHLRYLLANHKVTPETRLKIAERYMGAWPDCLACSLVYADCLMDLGEDGKGVTLLHQAAGRDVAGQVVRCLWGENHPYLPLWPEKMELALQTAAPAEVLKLLGWNQLPEKASQPAPRLDTDAPLAESLDEDEEFERMWEKLAAKPQDGAELAQSAPPAQEAAAPALAGPFAQDGAELAQSAQPVAHQAQPDAAQPAVLSTVDKSTLPQDTQSPAGLTQAAVVADLEQMLRELRAEAAAGSAELGAAGEPAPQSAPIDIAQAPDVNAANEMIQAQDGSAPIEIVSDADESAPAAAQPKAGPEDLLLMANELERLAKKLRMPGLTRQDGRFPVYVIFSVSSQLQAAYGEQVAEFILAEMEHLAAAVSKSRRWGAQVFLADDPAKYGPKDIAPAAKADAWDLKLAIRDLDASMAKRGEMIGALLIVGGPDVVPFHLLPNPVDDQDEAVPSDNPYATRDENYFIPEWPVGRLPGGAGGDASLLLAALRRMCAYHARQNKRRPWYTTWPSWLFGWMRPRKNQRKTSFGYTAAVWRGAAENVYRVIGEPRRINVSPPLGLDGAQAQELPAGGRNGQVPIPRGRLAYFNLHGLVNAPEWYGQRDPLDPSDGPDYPVALRPQDIQAGGRNGKAVPRVVFSEACYGAHIQGRGVDEAIALKFLEAGSLAVAGSTVMAYGSIDTPLVAADLLGHSFWKNFLGGMPCGEALSQAKIHLAEVMHKRQGYLDGEDQKSLISFVLYGDPLAASDSMGLLPKTVRHTMDALDEVKIICDKAEEEGALQEIPAEVMVSVKQVVAQYLPGMANARVQYAMEKAVCTGKGHACPTSQLGQDDAAGEQGATHSQNTAVGILGALAGQDESLGKPGAADGQAKSALNQAEEETPSRRLVILSKTIHNSHGPHAQYARLTLDEDSKLVKLVVSR